jgi:hypothetical protein
MRLCLTAITRFIDKDASDSLDTKKTRRLRFGLFVLSIAIKTR